MNVINEMKEDINALLEIITLKNKQIDDVQKKFLKG
jgi:hypothetical protein